jgi:hypothetical protein
VSAPDSTTSPAPRRGLPWSVLFATAAVLALFLWLYRNLPETKPKAEPAPRAAPILGLDDEATLREREAERARPRSEWAAMSASAAAASAAPRASAAASASAWPGASAVPSAASAP